MMVGQSLLVSYVAHVFFELLNAAVLMLVFFCYIGLFTTVTCSRMLDMNGWVELVWLGVPTVVVVVLVVWVVLLQSGLEECASVVGVMLLVGNQWFWVVSLHGGLVFVYIMKEQSASVGDLRCVSVVQGCVVGLGALIRVIVASADVIHAFALPVLGVKCDVVPGRVNSIFLCSWVSSAIPGQCSEICGTFHGFMPIFFFFF
nr:cytochrome c oxidase subunit 2 [Namystynia karyoxenos]